MVSVFRFAAKFEEVQIRTSLPLIIDIVRPDKFSPLQSLQVKISAYPAHIDGEAECRIRILASGTVPAAPVRKPVTEPQANSPRP